MTDWPEYRSHKIVRAAKIVSITRTPDDELIIWTGDYPHERFEPTRADMKQVAEVGAYAVIYAPDEKYPDGYRSVSPRKAFEEGYIPLSVPPSEPDTLERAIEHAINRFSAENGSNTPDFILARFLIGALAAWNAAVMRREEWHGRPFSVISDGITQLLPPIGSAPQRQEDGHGEGQ